MATVMIFRDEVEDGLLPHLCMKCGQPATHFKSRTFYGFHYDNIIPTFGLLFGPSMTVNVPLCDVHRFHWTIRTAVLIGGFLLLAGGFTLGMIAVSNQNGGSKGDSYAIVSLSSLAFATVWVIISIYLQHTTIQTYSFTGRWLILVGVAEEFREALLDERDYQDELDDEREDERNRQARRDREEKRSPHITTRPPAPLDDRMSS